MNFCEISVFSLLNLLDIHIPALNEFYFILESHKLTSQIYCSEFVFLIYI